MRIIIVGYHDIQASVPRASRVRELARELARRGHDVSVLCARFGIAERQPADEGYTVHRYGQRSQPSSPSGGTAPRRGRLLPPWLKSWLKASYLYFLGEAESRLIDAVARGVAALGPADMLISVSLPFAVHRGSARALRKGYLARVKVADCGDPYFENPNRRLALYHRLIERVTLAYFDFVTIPTEGAREVFVRAGVDAGSIHIIPQGFSLRPVGSVPRQPGGAMRLAYAGNLYPKIRNPSAVLQYLLAQPLPFEFHFYSNMGNGDNRSCLEPFLLPAEGKVIIHAPVSREACLLELANYDVLVNFRNESDSQVPSKLIDYAQVGKPILDISCTHPDLALLKAFLSGDFSGALKVDLSRHDIRRIAEQFLALAGGRERAGAEQPEQSPRASLPLDKDSAPR